jgi:hypothetical protein
MRPAIAGPSAKAGTSAKADTCAIAHKLCTRMNGPSRCQYSHWPYGGMCPQFDLALFRFFFRRKGRSRRSPDLWSGFFTASKWTERNYTAMNRILNWLYRIATLCIFISLPLVFIVGPSGMARAQQWGEITEAKSGYKRQPEFGGPASGLRS